MDDRSSECCRCRKNLTFDFLVQHTDKAFLLGEWQKKRKELLVELEMAQMPATQALVNQINTVTASVQELKTQKSILREEQKGLYKERNDRYVESQEIRRQLATVGEKDKGERKLLRLKFIRLENEQAELFKLEKGVWVRIDTIVRLQDTEVRRLKSLSVQIHNQMAIENITLDGQVVKAERQEFVMRCPRAACLGYMSTRYVCGLCDHRLCAQCHDPLDTDEHKCDDGKVETIKLIRREGKPCPKCSCIICKIDGCDQMWCIQCKTAFSWKTGRTETGRIHNPEYFRWMRENRKEAPRLDANVQQDQPACPATLNMAELSMLVENAIPGKQEDDVQFMYSVALTLNTRPEIQVDERGNVDLRVRFLTGEMSREEMERVLITRDRVRYKRQTERELWQLMTNITRDVSDRVIQAKGTVQFDEALDQGVMELRKMLEYHQSFVEQFEHDQKLKIPAFQLRTEI